MDDWLELANGCLCCRSVSGDFCLVIRAFGLLLAVAAHSGAWIPASCARGCLCWVNGCNADQSKDLSKHQSRD